MKGVEMTGERIAVSLKCEGMGDCLFAIPVLKKIARTKRTPGVLDIYTRHPELFVHCPYVGKAHPFDELAKLPGDAKLITLFELDRLPHWAIDTFDFISVPVGLGSLSFREKQLEYFPGEPDEAAAFDVVLNTSMTWPSRSWSLDNWQRLASRLIDRGLTVAVVGADTQSVADGMLKRSFPLEGCVNLVNRLSLDQTYYTIRKAGLFVSCQNGLSVLSGATDTELVILDMSIEWSKRAIYRHEDPLYKVTYAKGDCLEYCCRSHECPKPAGNFDCIPTFETVARIVDERLGARTSVASTAEPVRAHG